VTPTVAFTTLGCRLNQVDSHQLQALLEARGFRAVAPEEPADVVVVNTCAVTARAEFSDRQAIRRAARLCPRPRVVVTGCWAQTGPHEVLRLPEVDLVVGNADKARLPDLIEALLAAPPGPAVARVSPVGAAGLLPVAPAAHPAGRSRAFLKVQDGCQHRCAFCIVPRARGASRSLPPETVRAQAGALVAAGHRELTLTGVDLGHYGADLTPRATLATLLRDLVEIAGLRWVRLSSILPPYVTPALLEVIAASPVIAPHFHVPLQSGSDRILRAMRRPYTVATYRAVVERLATAVPGLGLGADVIVGFPGESEADFEATARLVEALPFSYLHVFPYSARPGTEAAGLAGRVEARRVARRSQVLRELSREKSRAFRERMVGRVEEVLVLDTRDRATGGRVGLTGTYVEVSFAGPETLCRHLARVRVVAAGRDRARGEVA
jgi:threonylcarbamoyladenosine tRNA methylthiotransferase MtaB